MTIHGSLVGAPHGGAPPGGAHPHPHAPAHPRPRPHPHPSPGGGGGWGWGPAVYVEYPQYEPVPLIVPVDMGDAAFQALLEDDAIDAATSGVQTRCYDPRADRAITYARALMHGNAHAIALSSKILAAAQAGNEAARRFLFRFPAAVRAARAQLIATAAASGNLIIGAGGQPLCKRWNGAQWIWSPLP
jgi:hypothetical protein